MVVVDMVMVVGVLWSAGECHHGHHHGGRRRHGR
jgi:hypothetical protein